MYAAKIPASSNLTHELDPPEVLQLQNDSL
jgi:hypothetical protein